MPRRHPQPIGRASEESEEGEIRISEGYSHGRGARPEATPRRACVQNGYVEMGTHPECCVFVDGGDELRSLRSARF
jgi:hypothetical protein